MHVPVIQVPVVVGDGSKQILVVSKFTICPPSPPVFRIKDIDKEVVITNKKVIFNKVILNGYIDKNINYKTIEHIHTDEGVTSYNGPLYHSTTQVPFSAFIDVEGALEGDDCEIERAYVEGEKDELYEPNAQQPEAYNKLLEKDVVKIVLKVTRTERITVNEC